MWAALLALYLIWGSTYLAIRFAVETMPPFPMGGLRFLMSGVLLFVILRLRGSLPPHRPQVFAAALLGVLLIGGGNGTVVWAAQRVPSGITAVLIATVPLWLVLLDWVRPGGRRPPARALLGVLIGFGGILLLVGVRDFSGAVDPLGAAVILAGAVLWSAGSLFSRGAALPESPLMTTSMQMLAGGLFLSLLGALTGQWAQFDVVAVSTRSWLAFFYLLIFGGLVAFSSYVWLIRVAPTAIVSTYAYVNPIVAIFLGSLLADEPVTLRTATAAAVILAAVIVTSSSARRH
jgi:drug/metabolite transporter (DMT)-like permease